MKVRCEILIALKHAVLEEFVERGIVQSVPSLTQTTCLHRVGIKLPLLSQLPRPLIPWLGHFPGPTVWQLVVNPPARLGKKTVLGSGVMV